MQSLRPTWVLKRVHDGSSFGQQSLQTGSGKASGKNLSPGSTGEALAFGEPCPPVGTPGLLGPGIAIMDTHRGMRLWAE